MKHSPDDLGLRKTSTDGLGLFDAVSARTVSNATRRQAQEQAEREGQRNRRLLLQAYHEHGRMTSDEAGAKVGLRPDQCRPRVCQLHTAGDLIGTGESRPSAFGNPMAVYEVADGR